MGYVESYKKSCKIILRLRIAISVGCWVLCKNFTASLCSISQLLIELWLFTVRILNWYNVNGARIFWQN